jgi:hypothetical protein
MRKLILVALAALAFAPSSLAASSPVVLFENHSSVVSDAQLAAELPAYQIAISRDFAPVWGTDATLTTDATVPHDMVVNIEDNATIAGALGYHEVVAGIPQSFIFAETSADYGEAESLVTTHELEEMLADPWTNRFAHWHNRDWLVEVADPVESGAFAYFVDGVAISDFITPAWYGGLRGPKDFTRHLRRAGQIGRHGYASYWDGTTWQQVFG